MITKSIDNQIACYENNGNTMVKYTVLFLSTKSKYAPYGKCVYDCIKMSRNPIHPQLFGEPTTAIRDKQLGKKIKFENLPIKYQQLVRNEYVKKFKFDFNF